jgi:hypothetical protein
MRNWLRQYEWKMCDPLDNTGMVSAVGIEPTTY